MADLSFLLDFDNTSVVELKLGQYMVGPTGPTGQDGPPGPEGTLTPDDTATLDQAVSDAQAAATAASGSAGAAANSATTAGNSATNASTSANNAAGSATAAANSASAAASSAGTASSGATTATSQATAAAGSATAANTSAGNAATSATTASNQATAAGNSASAALASQNAAASSASSASTSATNAASSASQAASSAANMLPKASPVIASGPLTFADGSQQGSAALSNRNYIVDGNFEQWSGSSAASNAGAYSPAVMFRSSQGGGASTVSQGTLGPGQDPAGMTSPTRYFYTHQQTTASAGTVAGRTLPYILQYMEDVFTLQGRSATFSCWLWCNSGTITIPNLLIAQFFGSGGSTSVIIDTPVNWVVTTSAQKFSVRVDFPSIAGKTLGTNHSLQIGLWLPANATYAVNTMQWQLEQSSPQAPAAGSPTPFEYRGQQAELARVQRCYEAPTWEPLWQGYTANGAAYNLAVPFKVTKRAQPGVTLFGGGVSNFGAMSVNALATDGVQIQATATAAGGGYFQTAFIADARL